MKANELMIGDWVRIAPYDIIDQVECLLTEYAVTGHGDTCGQYEYKDILPIPLTPEILEKNGFVKEEVTFAPMYYILYTECSPGYRPCPQKTVIIEFHSEYILIRIIYNGGKLRNCTGSIKYVHEFQHALRLCGIEKEIVL